MIGFGNFSKKRNKEIIEEEDLVAINPLERDFFDGVLKYYSENAKIIAFQKAVEEVKEEQLLPFWKPTFDPSEDRGRIVFRKGNMPALQHSYNWWENKASNMTSPERMSWQLGTEYQYYAFLVHLINQLVEKLGWNIGTAMEAVVLDSKELGHYKNSLNAIRDSEPTGSRKICDFSDLGNAYKILRCSNKEVGGLWLAGGGYYNDSDDCPLADLDHYTILDFDNDNGVGWLVLQ